MADNKDDRSPLHTRLETEAEALIALCSEKYPGSQFVITALAEGALGISATNSTVLISSVLRAAACAIEEQVVPAVRPDSAKMAALGAAEHVCGQLLAQVETGALDPASVVLACGVLAEAIASRHLQSGKTPATLLAKAIGQETLTLVNYIDAEHENCPCPLCTAYRARNTAVPEAKSRVSTAN